MFCQVGAEVRSLIISYSLNMSNDLPKKKVGAETATLLKQAVTAKTGIVSKRSYPEPIAKSPIIGLLVKDIVMQWDTFIWK